jgi:AraC-like DNA-binding protein
VFQFTYNYCDHTEYLHLLAAAMGVPVINNTILLPAGIGTGYIKVEELANGLQVLFNECTVSTPVLFHRNQSDGNGYTLRFDEVRNLEALSVKIGDIMLEDKAAIYSGAFLSNSFSELEYIVNAGIESRSINIYFTNDWLDHYSGLKATGTFLKEALTSPGSAIHFEVLTLQYRELMEEIFELKPAHPVYQAVLQNRVMLLLEKFLRGLYMKLVDSSYGYGIADQELKRMVQIEAILVKDLGVAPPPVSELARIAMMSETKLKYTFKRIYQYGLYEYYQKNRMMKARQLLVQKKSAVKEVGMQLGFKNLSNFTIAFKKEFNILPSQL